MKEVRNIKKFKVLIVLFLIAFVGTCLYNVNHKIIAKPETSVVDNRIDEIQAEIDKYKEKEQEEKLRRLRLQQLQNPEIIQGEFQKVGLLITYKGKMTYSDIIRESKWYGKKELHIELKYNIGIGIDLNKIVIDKFVDDVVVIKIPKKELKLQYVELNSGESQINGERTLFQKQYKPEDIETVIENAQGEVIDKINNSNDMFVKSMESLQEVIKELVLKLGYSDVIFTE